jgi:nucleoside-diphosphate-sugar epimerase
MSHGAFVIFGGTGYIGRKFCEHLLDRQQAGRILLADLTPPPAEWTNRMRSRGGGAIEFRACDVRQPIAPQLGAEPVDWIVNLAAVHREPGHAAHEYFDTNLAGARQVCAYAEQIACRTILFSSSIAVYGETRGPTDEYTPLYPDTPYGISKLCAELIHEGWLNKAADRKLVVVRPGVVYGPGDPGNILRMIHAIQRGLFFFPGDPEVRKSYAYISGLLESMVYTLGHRERFITCNYVEKDTESLRQLVAIVRRKLQARMPVLRMPIGALQAAAGVLQVLSAGRSGIHPARVRKAARPTHIVPRRLIELGFPFRYDFESSIEDWLRQAPEDFGRPSRPLPAATLAG